MIEFFGGLESTEHNSPINSESWVKLSIREEANAFSENLIDLQFNQISWMWKKFPKLIHLEIQNNTEFNPKIFEKILKYDEISSKIKHISNLPRNIFPQIDTSITINKSNVRLGVWIGDEMIVCKAQHAYIFGALCHWMLIGSPFDINKRFLIMWGTQIQFKLEELNIDQDWEESEQEFYSNAFNQYLGTTPGASSILFIVPICNISIPDNSENLLMELNINVNDYRPIYNLCWSQLEVNKELEKYIESIDKKSIIELSIRENISFIWIKKKSRISRLKGTDNKQENNLILSSIWKKLFSK